jgi:Putative stress-induced transcription regulator
MTWPAASCFSPDIAPAGLGLVHDLLATAAAGNPRRADLLATVASAQRWLAASTSAWADAAGVPAAALAGPLSLADLDEVVALRAAVFAAVTGSDAAETDQALDPTSVGAAIDAHGVVHLSSGGRASDLLRGRVLIEMYNAQLIGTWRRLKVCHNARCHEVFLRPVQEQQPNLVRHRRLCQRAQPARIPRTAQDRAIF